MNGLLTQSVADPRLDTKSWWVSYLKKIGRLLKENLTRMNPILTYCISLSRRDKGISDTYYQPMIVHNFG